MASRRPVIASPTSPVQLARLPWTISAQARSGDGSVNRSRIRLSQ
jgi:hypothetical protein